MLDAGLTGHVGTGQLLHPAIAGMDDAIAQPVAIADKKVVSEPLVAPRDMLAVYGLWINACPG